MCIHNRYHMRLYFHFLLLPWCVDNEFETSFQYLLRFIVDCYVHSKLCSITHVGTKVHVII